MDLEVAGAFFDGSSSPTYSDRRILGVRLRKFCLWHRLLLNAVDSPFMKRGAITMFDLRVAAGICRLKPFDSKVRKPWLTPSLIYCRAFIVSLFDRGHSGTPEDLNALQRSLKACIDVFLEYFKDYLQDPEYVVIPPETGRSQTPRTRGRFDDVIEHAGELMNWGIPEKEAWGMPIGKARIYRVMARRAAGNDIDIVTEEEREFMEHLPPEFRVAK